MSISANGSFEPIAPVAMIDFLVKSTGLNIETLLFSPLFSSISHPKSFPSFWKILAKVFILNFLARVRAHDSVSSHITFARLDIFRVKS